MAYWQMGCGIPIKNHSFRYGKYFEAQLVSNYTGGVTVSVDTDLRNAFATGDFVVIGPSSNSTVTNIGKHEIAKLADINAGNLVIESAFTYDYKTNDYISGIGSKIGAGWIFTVTYANYCRSGGIKLAGKEDNSCQKWGTLLGASGTTFAGLYQTINSTRILADTPYRLGCYYKFDDIAGTNRLVAKFHDGNQTIVNNVNVVNNEDVTSYTLFTATATTSSSPDSGAHVNFYVHSGSSGDNAYAYIDHIFLEHATGTDGSGVGYYTFTEYPEQNTVTWKRITPLAQVMMRNWQKKVYDSSGSGGKQYLHNVRCNFDNVSTTFYGNLQALINKQLEGEYLVLHHDIPKIPPVMVGTLQLSNEKWNIWDKTKVSFQFDFSECL